MLLLYYIHLEVPSFLCEISSDVLNLKVNIFLVCLYYMNPPLPGHGYIDQGWVTNWENVNRETWQVR